MQLNSNHGNKVDRVLPHPQHHATGALSIAYWRFNSSISSQFILLLLLFSLTACSTNLSTRAAGDDLGSVVDIYVSKFDNRSLELAYLCGYRDGIKYGIDESQDNAIGGNITLNRSTDTHRAYADGFEEGRMVISQAFQKLLADKDNEHRALTELLNQQ